MFMAKGDGEGLVCNIADTFDETNTPEPVENEVEDFNKYAKASTNLAQLTTKTDGHRPPINGDTLAANKAIGQYLIAIQETSKQIQLFARYPARQVGWVELGENLSYPANSTTHVPVPQTPQKVTDTFGTPERSLHFQDSHMVTLHLGSRHARLTIAVGQKGSIENTRRGKGWQPMRRHVRDDSSSDDEYDDPNGFGRDENDPTSELGQQIRDSNEMEPLDPITRFEIATTSHWERSSHLMENSMRVGPPWLRGFVYEMKAYGK
ncbi:hypothetical protein PHMEG_0007355 [Phytophthora megakarya]|uniref:Uncharacterized protein n=1 Tax=Phytophthora megakarya TaxID=4795 RepID=A0A225WLH3_9STRA|nr:hypothetical protein PHMEG_0007355 [Phytophthora megakarya]